jgi:hypothetical protein
MTFLNQRLAARSVRRRNAVALLLAAGWFLLWGESVHPAGFGDPRGFLTDETITETIIYPGVKYIRADGTHLGDPMVTHVVTVDMTNSATKIQMLPGERLVTAPAGFFRRSRVSHLQQDNNALIAVNAAFFDISGTMTPSGLHVRDSMPLRSPVTGSPTFAVSDIGVSFISVFNWNRTIRRGNSTSNFQGVNANTMNNDNIGLYQYPWDRSPGKDAAFITNGPVTEVVLEKVSFTKSASPTQRHVLRGRVLQLRTNEVSVGLNSTNFVLTGVGTGRNFLQKMTVGSTIDVDWILTGLPAGIDWNRVPEAVSGKNRLIINGVLQTGSGSHWETQHPRTAVGINASQTRMLFLLVEGRQNLRAEGMSLDSVRNYLSHMGAYHALEFDGGGSSAMAGRVGGVNKLLSTPSDGSERYVPSGLGVVAVPEEPHPFFINVRINAGHNAAAISWQTPEPATSWVLFGRENYDTASITNRTLSTNHTVFLHGLQSQSVYFFRMVAHAASGKRPSHGVQLATGTPVVVPPGEMPQWWRQHFFSTNTAPANADPDADRYSSYQEYIWGTVPNDVLSCPATDFARIAHQTLRLTFTPFRGDRLYHVQSSGNLATWGIFNAPMREEIGKGVVDLPIMTNGTNAWYRLRVTLP